MKKRRLTGAAMFALSLLCAVSCAAQTFTATMPSESLFLDAEWYRARMIKAADLWNGGPDGKSGMGAYKPRFNGFFSVALDRGWNPQAMAYSTSIAQSRGIFMNVEAYRAAGPREGARFLAAAEKGAQFLLERFHDPVYDGYFWCVTPGGALFDPMKQGYGQVHPMLALTQLYSVTGNMKYLEAALRQLDVFARYFPDPQYPAGVRPNFSRDWTTVNGNNNIDVFTHYFETLLSLYDVTEGADRERVGGLIVQEGDFLTRRLYEDQAGYADRGYIGYNYDADWLPSREPYTRARQWSGARQASTGHNIELAFLLSRAVERGFDPKWLDTARKMTAFCNAYAIDAFYGGMIYEVTDYDGRPLEGNTDNVYYLWWPQMETARAFLHLAVVRGWDTAAGFKKVEYFINRFLTDQENGGLYPQLLINSLGVPEPDVTYKGNIWKTNYHFTMFYTEALRLAEKYPDRIKALSGTPDRR